MQSRQAAAIKRSSSIKLGHWWSQCWSDWQWGVAASWTVCWTALTSSLCMTTGPHYSDDTDVITRDVPGSNFWNSVGIGCGRISAGIYGWNEPDGVMAAALLYVLVMCMKLLNLLNNNNNNNLSRLRTTLTRSHSSLFLVYVFNPRDLYYRGY